MSIPRKCRKCIGDHEEEQRSYLEYLGYVSQFEDTFFSPLSELQLVASDFWKNLFSPGQQLNLSKLKSIDFKFKVNVRRKILELKIKSYTY